MSEAYVGKRQEQKYGTTRGHGPDWTCDKADDTHNGKLSSSRLANQILKTLCEGRLLVHGGIRQGRLVFLFVYYHPCRKAQPLMTWKYSSRIVYKWDGARVPHFSARGQRQHET